MKYLLLFKSSFSSCMRSKSADWPAVTIDASWIWGKRLHIALQYRPISLLRDSEAYPGESMVSALTYRRLSRSLPVVALRPRKPSTPIQVKTLPTWPPNCVNDMQCRKGCSAFSSNQSVAIVTCVKRIGRQLSPSLRKSFMYGPQSRGMLHQHRAKRC